MLAGLIRRLTGTRPKRPRMDYDGARLRRRLKTWQPTQNTINTILASQGDVLRARCRDVMRNNAHAVSAGESFAANLIGTGIKPSSLLSDRDDEKPTNGAKPNGKPKPSTAPPDSSRPQNAFPPKKDPVKDPREVQEKKGPGPKAQLRKAIMDLWLEWTDDADADGIQDFYGLQSLVARALFESGECFIRFRPRKAEDNMLVPLQLQVLESDMCPYHMNERAKNNNFIMNGIEFSFIGKRRAYYFYPIHPGDAAVEVDVQDAMRPVRVPADQVLHIFKPTRPGQVRGVPLLSPALVRLFLLDQYDDAELERKRTAALFAGFVESPVPITDVFPEGDPNDRVDDEEGALSLVFEPGTIAELKPGEKMNFSEPADVGGNYEDYQYRQQLAIFAALGIPYSVGTSDLRRANYSSLRGSIVEYRRKLEQFQHNIIVFQMCRPVWNRWLETAVLADAIDGMSAAEYLADPKPFQKVRWIPQRNDWVDPLKDRQAEKLAVDSGFKSRSDVVEAEGYDPEENDLRVQAEKEREQELNLVFPFAQAASNQPLPPEQQAEKDAQEQQMQEDALEQAQADRDTDVEISKQRKKPPPK